MSRLHAAPSAGLGRTSDPAQRTSSVSVVAGEGYFVFCDYDDPTASIAVTGAAGSCSFNGWVGAGAATSRFFCGNSPGMSPGTYAPTCTLLGPVANPVVAGTLTVQAPPPPPSMCTTPVAGAVGLGVGSSPSGASSSLGVTVGEGYFVFCDFGRTDVTLDVTGAAGPCGFNGWIGTAGRFYCGNSPNMSPGTYHPTCQVAATAQICATSASAGTLTVQSAPMCMTPSSSLVGLGTGSSPSGASSSLGVTVGEGYFVFCDFGRTHVTLDVTGAAGPCGFNGWTGTTGRFYCGNSPKMSPGTYHPTCQVAATAQICATSASAGTLTVQATPTCTSPTVRAEGLGAGSDPAAMAQTLSIYAGSGYYLFCDYGRTDLSIDVSGASGPCSPNGWAGATGTTARFFCGFSPNMTPGTYHPTCQVAASATVCAASTPLGTLTVQ